MSTTAIKPDVYNSNTYRFNHYFNIVNLFSMHVFILGVILTLPLPSFLPCKHNPLCDKLFVNRFFLTDLNMFNPIFFY